MAVLSRREWLCKAGIEAVVLVLGTALPRKLFGEEPRIIVSPLNKLSDEDEISLGRRFSAELEREEPIVTNPLIDAYLGSLMSGLASNSQRPNLPYSVRLVNSHVPNACSLPGGFLYVNRGLVELVDSEDELVATLAHEIGHIAGRHVINQLVLTFAARALLGPVLDDLKRENGEIERTVLQFGGAIALMAKIHFSRQDEMQADLLGFYEMLHAGWDPHGYLKLFAQLEKLEKASSGTSAPFLSGHPPTLERKAAIQRELTLIKVPEKANRDSLKFQIFKSAMALLPNPPAARPANS